MALRDVVAALLGVSTYQKPKGYGPELDDEQVKAVREALSGQIQALPTTKLRWYLADLETAQVAADAGNLRPAAQLYRAMKRDGTLMGLLSTRSAGLVRLPKRFYGDKELADKLQANNGSRPVFDEMLPPAELSALAADGVSLGIGVAELVPVVGRDYPVMIRLDPEFLQYRWSENRWYFLGIAGAMPITPGDGRWILHIPGARMSPWHFGLWPAMGRSFINKEHAIMGRANFSAKLANPARVAQAPLGATQNERRGFLQRLIAWGRNTVFELPVGWEVKLVESNGRGWEVFQSEIDTSDIEYTVGIAGQVVTTTGGTGFANADIHRRIREDLIKGDGDALAYTINTQALPQYIINQTGSPEGLATRWVNVQWDTATPKELETEAKTLQALSQAIMGLAQVLSGTDRRLNLDELATRFGIPLTSNEAMGDVTAAQAELAVGPEPAKAVAFLRRMPAPYRRLPLATLAAHIAATYRADKDFDENKHPRKDNGEFGSGGGGGGGESKPADKKETKETQAAGPKETAKYYKADKGRKSRLENYTGGDFAKMNEFLRNPDAFAKKHGDKEADKWEEKADQFHDDISGAPVSPGTSFRGAKVSPDVIKQFKAGGSVKVEGFWSTSQDQAVAEGFATSTAKGKDAKSMLMHITHKTGVDVSGVSAFPEEKEVLVKHGARFKVSKVESKGGIVHVHLEEQ